MKKLNNRSIIIFCCFLLLSGASLIGCAREISSDVYHAPHVGETSRTYRGTIIEARRVVVHDKEKLEDHTTGIVGGGVGGAIVGSQVGGGSGRLVGGAVGAVAGAVGGAYAEKALKSQNAIEYIVELTDGSARSVVQAPEPVLSIGQKVYLIESTNGRSRIIAR